MQADAAHEDCNEVARETEICVKQALCIQHLRKDDVAEDVMDLRDCAAEADRAGVSTAASGSTRSPRTPLTFGGRTTSSAGSAGFGPEFCDGEREAGHSIEIQPWRQPSSERNGVLRGRSAEEEALLGPNFFVHPGRAGSAAESLGAIPEDQEGSEATAAASVSPLTIRIPIYGADSSTTPAITFDWFLQLSRRSGVSCMDSVASARSALQASVQMPSSRETSVVAEAVSDAGTVQWQEDSPLLTAEADSVQSFGSPTSGSDHHSLASYSYPGTVHEEEAVSVLDVADEQMVVSAPSMVETASLNVVDGIITDSSPNSSVFASPRPHDSVGSLLQRLAFESQLLDESVESSVRRVFEMQMAHAQDAEGPRLTQAEIRELPQVRYRVADQQQCAICLEMFQEGEMLTLLRCEHYFHMDCVASWMQRAIHCPLCRTCVVEDKAESGTVESEV